MSKPFIIRVIRVFLFVTGLLVPAGVFAQGFSNYNWYFGTTKRDLRFSRSDNSASLVTNQGVPFGQGGSAVATDPVTGDVLFYTDGNVIYDASHQPMSSALGGSTGQNQPVAIC